MELKGKRVTIKPIKLDDVYHLKEWGSHENPLLADYNFSRLSREELLQFYYYKANNRSQQYFSVFNEEGKLIGYFGLKKIRKRFFKDSILGIVFDPNHVNNGYGTETILTLFDYYFSEMHMKKLYLDVSKFNKRAMRCYEKSGFKIIDSYSEKFFDQTIDKADPYFKEEESSFVIRRGKIYNYIYRMKIDRKAYLEYKKNHFTLDVNSKIRPTIQ